MNPHRFETPFGWCELQWENDSLHAFRLLVDPPDAQGAPDYRPASASSSLPPWITALAARARLHLSGTSQDFRDTPFAFDRVTPFQAAVYRAALTVSSGETRTYGWLAARIGRPPGASRAVGTALGQNPWPLLVPCHRFISASGKLTGFSAPGGIATKRRLLVLEGAELALA